MQRNTALLVFAVYTSTACTEEPADADANVWFDDPAAHADFVQPPISGGTLLVTRDGRWVVASDADADRVSIVAIRADTPGCGSDCPAFPELVTTVELPRAEEPGRLAEDEFGRVHVVLRRGGAIATIELASGAEPMPGIGVTAGRKESGPCFGTTGIPMGDEWQQGWPAHMSSLFAPTTPA